MEVDETAGEGADTHGDVTYGDEDRVEVICLDYEDGQDVVKAANIRLVFNSLKRKRKPGRYCTSPYTTPPATTAKRRRSSRINRENPSPPNAPDFDDTLEPFVENLSRTGTRKKTTKKVTVPCSIQKILNENNGTRFIFSWDNEDTIAERRFWECLLATGDYKDGWLRDEVLFPINEPNKHWAVGELHLRTGVLTLYDSLPKFTNRRLWWKDTMPANFQYWLPKLLDETGVFSAKGIDINTYQISFKKCDVVPNQATQYGDCGIWACINLYRLSHNMSLKSDDPAQTALAYRERIVEYLWKYKVEYAGH